jgi:hypothetical protein
MSIKKTLPASEFSRIKDEESLKAALSKVESAVKSIQKVDTSRMETLIAMNNDLLASLAQQLSRPHEKATDNTPKIIEALNANKEAIMRLVELESQPEPEEVETKKEWAFEVKRGITGFIEQITAKEK